jgi:hypothetical protein
VLAQFFQKALICFHKGGAVELEQLLPGVGNIRHAVVILRLRVYAETSSTCLRLLENYVTKLTEN